ncbi:MAG: alpha/beta fold hydrolase [Marinagarivorans sp.]
MNYLTKRIKNTTALLFSVLLVSCVQVDICRWAATPTIDSTVRSHGVAFRIPTTNMDDLPLGSTLKYSRISSEDNQVNLSITEFNIPTQHTAIVYCGGNAFRQGQSAHALFKAFSPATNILLFDYPGYGQSTGEATAQEFVIATDLLWRHIAKWQRDNNFTKVIFWGRSFGGTICARLAGKYPLNSTLVLESTYNNLQSLVSSRAGIFRSFLRVNFDAESPDFQIDKSLENYTKPIALLKSSNDPVIPPEESLKLAKRLVSQGKSVDVVNMGAISHKEVLEYPCIAANVFKKIGPAAEGIAINSALCAQQ